MTDQEKVIRMIEIRLTERPDLKKWINERVLNMFTPGETGYEIMLDLYNTRFPYGEQ